MPPLRLSNPQLLTLRNLLKRAFLYPSFRELLMRLDQDMTSYAPMNAAYPEAMLETLRFANAKLWWRDLLREACNEVLDPQLRQFAGEVGFAPDFSVAAGGEQAALMGSNLELKIKSAGTTFDIMIWRQRLGEIENRVCRIEYPELQARGTGFLVASDLVLTNYHVIEPIHKGLIAPDKIVLRFDYKLLKDGVSVGPGTTYSLKSDWLVDHSPYSAKDFQSNPSADTGKEELDYALLRLSARAGDDALGGMPRRWIQLPEGPHDFAASRALYIVQHPDGKPMQIAIDSEAVIMASPTRVRYTTTTEPGSSGSPCFGADWQWVALHHSGDPKYWTETSKPEYRSGHPRRRHH